VNVQTSDDLQQILTRTGSSSSEEAALRSLLRRYRPLSEAVLNTVREICPSPVEAARHVRPRALALAKPDWNGIDDTKRKEYERIQHAVHICDGSSEAPTMAYVCKFMAADRSQIRDPNNVENENAPSSVILGLARVLSGRLKTGATYHVMGPKHKFDDPRTMIRSRPVRLFLLMGSSFVLVDEVPAGHLCAIQNLEDAQFKTATISDSPCGMPLLGFSDAWIRPLVKVNVESVDPSDTSALEKGLIRLCLADAAVEVTATAKGERILACLGELHLEQTIIDLQRIYCDKKDIQLRVSEPIVEFGESTAWFGTNEMDFQAFLSDSSKKNSALRQTTIAPYNEEEGIEFSDRGRARSIVSGRVCAVSLRVVPLDLVVYESLRQGKLVSGCEDTLGQLKRALGFQKGFGNEETLRLLLDSVIATDGSGNAFIATSALESGRTVLAVQSEEIFVKKNSSVVEDENLDGLSGFSEFKKLQKLIRDTGFVADVDNKDDPSPIDASALEIWRHQMKGSTVAGFQMAMRHGPFCEEPVRSVLVVLEGLEVALEESGNGFKAANQLTGGMVAAAIRIGIRSALLYVIDPFGFFAYYIYFFVSVCLTPLVSLVYIGRDLLV
jgi:ribosome assembly protein 1